MTDKPSRGAPLIVIVTLLLLPLGYLGSYAALADTSGGLVMGEDSICYVHHYRYGGKVAEVLYWPLHQIDRQLRDTDE